MGPRLSTPGHVPVIPNASRIRGRVLRMRPERDGSGSVWDVALTEAEDVGPALNFAQGYVGDTIPLFVHRLLGQDVAVQDTITAKVAYRGDERGGLFAVLDDDLRKA